MREIPTAIDFSTSMRMAALVAALLALGLIACSSSQVTLATLGPNAMLDWMKGQGAVSQGADGSKKFVFTIPADAYNGMIPPEQHEAQRMAMLEGWLGSAEACERGYDIVSRSEAHGAIVYEGRCRQKK